MRSCGPGRCPWALSREGEVPFEAESKGLGWEEEVWVVLRKHPGSRDLPSPLWSADMVCER